MSIPIILPVHQKDVDRLKEEPLIILTWKGEPIAVVEKPEIYPFRREEVWSRIFGINSDNHPYIEKYKDRGEFLIGGKTNVINSIKFGDGFDNLRKSPKELREAFLESQADAVVCFQLRNPLHNGHVLLLNESLDQLRTAGFRKPILLLHPLGGWTKDDDVPLEWRLKQHQKIIEDGDLPKETMLAVFPSPMLYGGPVEVQWHARARMFAGCTHYIVGRDPAGVNHPDIPNQSLYHEEHGKIALSTAPGLGLMSILPFRVAAYDVENGKMAFFDPKRSGDFKFISGSLMRQLAREKKNPPDGFMSVNAWEVLLEYYSLEH